MIIAKKYLETVKIKVEVLVEETLQKEYQEKVKD